MLKNFYYIFIEEIRIQYCIISNITQITKSKPTKIKKMVNTIVTRIAVSKNP